MPVRNVKTEITSTKDSTAETSEYAIKMRPGPAKTAKATQHRIACKRTAQRAPTILPMPAMIPQTVQHPKCNQLNFVGRFGPDG